jgi:hypothetical protein
VNVAVTLQASPGIYLSHWLEHHVPCVSCRGQMHWKREVPGLHRWAALCCGRMVWFEFGQLPRVN